MEVETHTVSSFDLNSTSSAFSCSVGICADRSETEENSGKEMPQSRERNGFVAPAETIRECESSETVLDLVSTHAVVFDCGGVGEVKDVGEQQVSSVSTAAMKVQKVYRSYRTRRKLADSAVVAEELWWQALDYARLNHSTISFFNFPKPETAASRWSRITLNASKVGKGLSEDDKAQKLAFQHWIEAIDPQHRYGHSLHLYFEEWCKADAGQPFFYWLDVGDGKDVNLKECPRSKLRQQCIKYLGPQERKHYEYIVVDGMIVHEQTGNLFDTTKGLPGAKWIFVMSTSRKLYAGLKQKGTFHHSSFLAGGATVAAGRLEAEDGRLKSISAYSGHYRPTEERLDNLLSFLKENGVNLDEVVIRKEENDEERKSSSEFSDSNSNSQKFESPTEEQTEVPCATDAKNSYKRTLSGGLQSPKADVPKTAMLQRINSKKAAMSYQLGHQLAMKWSTGVGPRIGCVADYPVALRLQALEFTNLSPRIRLPTSVSSLDIQNGDLFLTSII